MNIQPFASLRADYADSSYFETNLHRKRGEIAVPFKDVHKTILDPGSCDRGRGVRPGGRPWPGRGGLDDSEIIVSDYGKAPPGALRSWWTGEGSPRHGGHPNGAWKRLYRMAPARARIAGRAEGPRGRRADHRRGRPGRGPEAVGRAGAGPVDRRPGPERPRPLPAVADGRVGGWCCSCTAAG